MLDHQPHAWFLLEDRDTLFLDVACSHSAVDYSVLIELNNQEVQSFKRDGRVFLDQLAYDIHYSAPGVRGSQSPYKLRNLTPIRGNEVDIAVKGWRALNGG